MKKLLLSFFSLTALALQSIAIEPYVIEFTKGSENYDNISAYNKTWNTKDGMMSISDFNNNNRGWDFIAAGSKNADTKPAFATLKESDATISTIVATIGDRLTKSAITSATLYVSAKSDFSDAVETDIMSYIPDATNSEMTIDVPAAEAGSYVKVEFVVPKASANGQAISLSKIVINYAEAGEVVLKPAELSFSETAFTLYADKVADFKAPALVNPNNLAVTYASSDENVAEVAADGSVTLTGDAGTAKITASFAGNAEYREGEASYTITVKETPKAVATVAATLELAANTEFVVDYDLTVAYVNSINAYAYTADNEFILLYGANEYQEGDFIAKGWTAQYAPYNNLPEVKPVGEFPAAASNDGKKFTPAEVAAADVTTALVNHIIVVKNVVFEAATPDKTGQNFTGKVGETSLTFRSNFKLDAQEAGTYNVTAAVAVFSTTLQLYPIAYELVEAGETPEPVEPEVTEVKTVAETIALATDTKVKVGYALTVGFSNGGNIFACDETGDFIQVYANDRKNPYKVGDVIPAGWEATYKFYNNVTPELEIASVEGLPAATEGSFTPKTVAAADITVAMVNSVVKIENVVFDAATPSEKANFNGKVGDTELSFRNNYTLESVEAGKYDVTVVVTVYNNAPSLYVVNYEKVATDGISEIEAEEAEAVYYNLQGVEVANPANGVYIVRRGAKVTKEFIR